MDSDEQDFIYIKIRNESLYLHKASNMFTTDIKQARKYKTFKNAQKWVDNISNGQSDYFKRFKGLEFVILLAREGEMGNGQ